MKCWTSLKIGHLGSKPGHLVKPLRKSLYALRRPHFWSYTNETWSEILPMRFWTSLIMDHLKTKTRSLGQIKKKKKLLYAMQASVLVQYS